MNPIDSSAPATDAFLSAHRATTEALAYSGLAASDVQGAIIAGGVTLERLFATARLLPSPRRILLLDSLDSLMELERRAEGGTVPAELAARCTTIVLSGPPAPYCLQAYLAIWEFLMAHDLDPSAIALNGTGHSADEELLRGAYAAATDLLLGNSSQFLARVERRRLPVQQVADWATFAALKGSIFHALKLLHALADVVGRETLAPNIVELWAALGCPEPALDWLDALAPEQRRACEQPLRQVAAAREQVLRETLEHNRASLARAGVSLPAAAGGEHAVHVVLLPHVPWLPAPGVGARRDRYPCLFRIRGGQLVELSPQGHPRALFESLRKQRRAHPPVTITRDRHAFDQ